MKRLEVILEKHAFINILASGLESYDSEVYGSIYGKRISDECYTITNAFPSVTAKRKPTQVTWFERFSRISSGIGRLEEKYLGDYHSHPGNMPHYSKIDKKEMKYDRSSLYIICSIIPMVEGYQSREWGTKNLLLTGTFDFDRTKYLFKFALYYFKHWNLEQPYGKPKLAKLICPYAEKFVSSVL